MPPADGEPCFAIVKLTYEGAPVCLVGVEMDMYNRDLALVALNHLFNQVTIHRRFSTGVFGRANGRLVKFVTLEEGVSPEHRRYYSFDAEMLGGVEVFRELERFVQTCTNENLMAYA